MAGRLVSPNELFQAAKDEMLAGAEPETERDWAKVMNFMAANIALGLEIAACKLLAGIYQMPLSEAYVIEIAEFQRRRKA